MSHVLFVDSRDRVAGTASKFTLTLRETLKMDVLTRIRVDQLRFVNSFNLVNDRNRYVYVREQAFTVSATSRYLYLRETTNNNVTLSAAPVRVVELAVGTYLGAALATALRTKLTSGAPAEMVYSVSYNSALNQLSVTATGGRFLVLTDEEIALQPLLGPSAPSSSAPYSVNSMLQTSLAARTSTSFLAPLGYRVRAVGLELGSYTGANLATNIMARLNADASPYAYLAEYITTSNSLRIASLSTDAPFRLLTDTELGSMSFAYPAGATGDQPLSLNMVLGNPYGATQSATEFLCRFLSTRPYDAVYLRSRQLSTSSADGPNNSHDVLCKVDVDVGFGGIVTGGLPDWVSLSVGAFAHKSLDFE
jgi:hypothetical protein